jgi:hypothetical protein
MPDQRVTGAVGSDPRKRLQGGLRRMVRKNLNWAKSLNFHRRSTARMTGLILLTRLARADEVIK